MAKKIYRGGVFGFGGMGQGMTNKTNNLGWYGDDFKIVGVCNRGEPKRKIAEEVYGLKAFKDPRDLIAMGLDFGLVTSTNAAHLEHVTLLAEAGLPILCEKPITLDIDEANQMVATVEKAGVLSVVNYVRRESSVHKKIKKMMEEGEFGQVIGATALINRGYDLYAAGAKHRAVVEPEESGGWTIHHACHQVDVLHWWLGEIDSVSEVSRSTVPDIESMKGLPSEEFVVGNLYFKNGALGVVIDSSGGAKTDHITVTGTKMSVEIIETKEVEILNCKKGTGNEYTGRMVIDPRVDCPHQDNLHYFYDQIRAGKTDSYVSIKDAAYSLKVCHAMRESAAQNGKVIQVNI